MICKEEISEGGKYMKNENTDKVIPAWRFVTKVMIYHIVTYIICGMIFSHLMNYKELFELGNMKYYMRPAESIHSMVGPFFQFVRGLLFGVVLYVILQIYPSFAFFPSFLDFCAWLVVKFYRFWLNEKWLI